MICSTAIFIIVSLAFGNNVNGQDVDSLPAPLLDKISELANIPGLNETAMNQVENLKNKIKEKCDKNGGSYDKLVSSKDDFESCVKGLIDVNILKDEIEKAKPHGELDRVFQKYCQKNVTVLKCMRDFISGVEPCFDHDERENLQTIPNVTTSFLNFICHKEGDRIALFIAAAGPECFSEKQNDIQDCFNQTYGSYVPKIDINGTTPNFPELPSLVFSLQQCNNGRKVKDCVVKELEKCDDPTPGNMADALFTFIINATPCKDMTETHANAVVAGDLTFRSTASTLMNTYSIILLGATVMLKYI